MKRARARVVLGFLGWLVLVVVTASDVGAQCADDTNLDGRINAAEFLTVWKYRFPAESFVRDLLHHVFAPCPEFCKFLFTDLTGNRQCVYSGSVADRDCVAPNIQVTWTSDGQFITILFLNLTLAPFPGAPGSRVFMGAEAESPRFASLVGWWTEGSPILTPVSGRVSIGDPVRDFVVDPGGRGTFTGSPFRVEGCEFRSYVSEEFVGTIPVP